MRHKLKLHLLVVFGLYASAADGLLQAAHANGPAKAVRTRAQKNSSKFLDVSLSSQPYRVETRTKVMGRKERTSITTAGDGKKTTTTFQPPVGVSPIKGILKDLFGGGDQGFATRTIDSGKVSLYEAVIPGINLLTSIETSTGATVTKKESKRWSLRGRLTELDVTYTKANGQTLTHEIKSSSEPGSVNGTSTRRKLVKPLGRSVMLTVTKHDHGDTQYQLTAKGAFLTATVSADGKITGMKSNLHLYPASSIKPELEKLVASLKQSPARQELATVAETMLSTIK